MRRAISTLPRAAIRRRHRGQSATCLWIQFAWGPSPRIKAVRNHRLVRRQPFVREASVEFGYDLLLPFRDFMVVPLCLFRILESGVGVNRYPGSRAVVFTELGEYLGPVPAPDDLLRWAEIYPVIL